MGGAAPAPGRVPVRRSQEAGDRRGLDGARPLRTARLEQMDHRQLPVRCRAADSARRALGCHRPRPVRARYRFSRAWEPTEQFFADLTRPDGTDDRRCRPYPFHRPAPFNPRFGRQPAERHFAVWHIEWKWSGIRVQVVRRGGRSFIWSEASDLLTDAFPEVRNSALVLRDGVVLDGEIVAWCDGAPGPFKSLRPRLHRSSASRSLLSAAPICFLASDILEAGGRDIRH